MNIKNLNVVAAALVNQNKQVLFAKRPKNKEFADYWEFPGGKLQNNETFEDALIRELEEELNIKVAINNLEPVSFVSLKYTDYNFFMPLFLCREWLGEIKNLEHQEIGFFSIDETKNLLLPPADIQLIEKLKLFMI